MNDYGGVKGLTVYEFYGYNPDSKRLYEDKNGAVVIQLSYPSTTGRWAQMITTDSPMGNKTSPYWDSNGNSIYYPYQWREGNNVFFYDNPSRSSDCTWRADLMLYDRGFIALHLTYGFSIVNGKTIVTPLTVVYP